MLCDFATTRVGKRYRHTCRRCKRTWVKSAERYHRRCEAGVPAAGPSQHRRLANFTLAAIQHVAKGCPTCTQVEIDARIAVCHGCDLYLADPTNPDVGVCSHRDCGCTVTRQDRFLSKLAWRDQRCPLGKWSELLKPGRPTPTASLPGSPGGNPTAPTIAPQE